MRTIVLLLAACSPPEGALSDASTLRHPAYDPLSQTLEVRGIDAEVALREAALIGSEQGWEIFRVPAFPAGREPFRIVAMASVPRTPPDAVYLHGTTTNWATDFDVRGAMMNTPDGRPMYVWGPASLPAPTEVRFAVRVEEPALDIWLNNSALDYLVPITQPVPATWIGNPWTAQDGLARMNGGDGLYAGHDTTVYESTWPQTPDVSMVVRWSVDGVDQLPVTMAITAVNDGQFAADTRWEATLPTAGLAVGAQVRWKFVARSTGPDITDDNSGVWYQYRVVNPPEVMWMDQGVYSFSQCHWDGWSCYTGWAWSDALPQPLDATPGQYQAYAAAPYPGLEVWVPGVTDATQWDPAAAGFLRVEVVSPFFAEDPTAGWLSHPMRYTETVGANMRYQWLIRDFHVPGMPPEGAMCPTDAVYPYRFRVSADGGTTWTSLGAESFGAPQTSDSFFIWQNFFQAPPVTQMPGGALQVGTAAVGGTTQATLTLVNTNNEVLELSGWSFDDSGRWRASWQGCPDATACVLRLQPGGQKDIRVSLQPDAVGPFTTTLRVTRDVPGACVAAQVSEFVVEGAGR